MAGGLLTDKPSVVEHLFSARYDPVTKTIGNPIVNSDDLVAAIEHCNKVFGKSLSTKNPANFLKDYLRSPKRNESWPASLVAAGFTARQKYRKKRVFAFVPFVGTEPFPDPFVLGKDATEHIVEAISLPSDARALGRTDEAWLIQVCVHQRVLQTHFGLYSGLDVVDMFHLQNSVKATPEIDAIFLMTYRVAGKILKALVTLEAKRNEPILADQIRAQVAYIANQCSVRAPLRDVSMIVPVAGRGEARDSKRVIAVFAMEPISVATATDAYAKETEHLLPMVIKSRVAYRFQPKVSGI